MTATPGTIPALTQYQPGALTLAGTEALEIVNTTNATSAASYYILLTDLVGKAPGVMADQTPTSSDLVAFYRPGTGLYYSTSVANLGGGLSATTSVNIVQIGGASFGLGQATMAGSMPVAIASNQSNIPVNLMAVGGTAVSIGQQVAASSIPVVLPSNQVVSSNITQFGGVAVTIGRQFMTASIPVVIATDQVVPVSGSFTLSTASVTVTFGTTSVDLVKIGGTAVSIGQAVMATSLPVAIASDQSAIPVTFSGTSAVNLVQVGGTAFSLGQKIAATSIAVVLASDVLATTNIMQVGGTAISLGQKIMATSLPVAIASDQSNLPVNLSTILGSSIVTAGVNGLLAVGGATASGGGVTGNPVYLGARAGTGELATTSNAAIVPLAADNVGKLIVSLNAGKASFVAGKVVANTTVATTVIGAINATNRIYLTGIQFGNTSASTIVVTLNDPSSSQFVVPTGGGSNIHFGTPIAFGLGSAVLATCSIAIATAYIAAQGYSGV